MAMDKLKEGFNVTKGVFLAYCILILHVLLIAGLGILVIFFRGMVSYMTWIFIGGTTVLLLSAYYFYRKMKAQGKTIRDILNSPSFSGRSVEVSLLGGLASLKVGRPDTLPALSTRVAETTLQIEDPETLRTRELTELARLYEKELITQDEYTIAKRQLLKH